MKTSFLKGLGIEDQETINAIMAENGKDINNVRDELDETKKQLTQLKNDLENKTTELDTLKEHTKDYDGLQEKINQLELDKATLTTEKAQLQVDLDTKMGALQKTHAIENALRDSGAKNIKATMALLDLEKITFKDSKLTGITEQLEQLKGGEDTAFLFGTGGTGPSGTTPASPPNPVHTPPTSDFAAAVAKAFANSK